MGLRAPPISVMDWMSTLDRMKAHGTCVRALCQNKACLHYWDWPVDDLIAQIGSDKASVWDRHPPCEKCGADVLFHASAGPSTPSRPLISEYRPPEGLPIQSLMDGWVGMRYPRRRR